MIGVHHFQYDGIGTTTITAEHSRLMQADGLHKLRVNMIDHVHLVERSRGEMCSHVGKKRTTTQTRIQRIKYVTLGEMPRSETSRRAVTGDA